MPNRTSKHRRAFTLVEVLVVTAIVLVLAGLVFVLGRQAVRQAKTTTCISNVGQIGKALLMYAGDADDASPPVGTRDIRTLVSGTEGSAQEEQILIPGDAKRWRSLLAEYTRNEEVFYCPEDKFARTNKPLPSIEKLTSEHTSYETVPLPFYTTDRLGGHVLRLGSVDQPWPYLQDNLHTYRDMKTGKLRDESCHGDTITMLFVDGHVEHGKIQSEYH